MLLGEADKNFAVWVYISADSLDFLNIYVKFLY